MALQLLSYPETGFNQSLRNVARSTKLQSLFLHRSYDGSRFVRNVDIY